MKKSYRHYNIIKYGKDYTITDAHGTTKGTAKTEEEARQKIDTLCGCPYFSKCAKLQKALETIYEDLQELGGDVARYKKEFPRESDFNICQYGNMLVYFNDIKDFYKACGYKSVDKWSDEKAWNIYKCQTGFVARWYF